MQANGFVSGRWLSQMLFHPYQIRIENPFLTFLTAATYSFLSIHDIFPFHYVFLNLITGRTSVSLHCDYWKSLVCANTLKNKYTAHVHLLLCILLDMLELCNVREADCFKHQVRIKVKSRKWSSTACWHETEPLINHRFICSRLVFALPGGQQGEESAFSGDVM